MDLNFIQDWNLNVDCFLWEFIADWFHRVRNFTSYCKWITGAVPSFNFDYGFFCGRIWSQTWQCGSLEPYHLLWLHLKVMFTLLIHRGTCSAWAIRITPTLRVSKELQLFTTMASQNHGCRLASSISDHFGPSTSITLMILLRTATSWNHSRPTSRALNTQGQEKTQVIQV